MKSYFSFKFNIRKSFIFGLFFLLTCMASSLQAQTITLLSPNGGEVWEYGENETVSWTGDNLSSSVLIEFSYNGGSYWWPFGQFPSGPNGGNATVTIVTVTSNALIRITDVNNPLATDVSDEPFTIFYPAIFIWEPNALSYVFANSLNQVYWILNVAGINLLNVEISTDGGQTFELIAENINAQLSYTYLELSDTPSDSCILRLYNAEDPSEYGLSDVFTISPLPVYTLISPSAGELVNTNKPYTITWTVENPYSAYCYLEYSANNGQTWEVINNGTSQGNTGSYEWFTPNVNSEECLVRITDSYSPNSSDTSELFNIFPFPETPVCMVSVDSLTNFNVIIWEKPVSDLISDFLVYKETDEANVYEVIDTVGYEETTMVTDFGSNPVTRPYRYKIGFIDVENRLFPAGDYHQTIHLTINQGVNSTWNLIWTSYIGFDYSSYKIMRKTDSGIYEQIATVSASFNSFTDINAPPGEVYYMIKIVHPYGCDPATRDGEYASVYSNVASNSLVSVTESIEPNFIVYPNPAHKQINISFDENISGMATLKISDLTGRVVYSEAINEVRPGQLHSINSSNFNEGIYLLEVISGENRITKKIFIQH